MQMSPMYLVFEFYAKGALEYTADMQFRKARFYDMFFRNFVLEIEFKAH